MKTLLIIGLGGTLVLGAGTLAGAQMMGGFGSGEGEMGRAMMGHAWSAPGGEGGWHSMGFSVSGITLSKEQALQIAQAHLQAVGNPNLRLGDVGASESHFQVLITTKDGSLVERLLVDRRTGWLRSAY